MTADGRQVVASEDENPELFWGLRGGGGNFGVVTAFHFRLHPVGPIVLGGMLLYPAPMAGDLVRFYRDFMADAPDEVGSGLAFITAPPEEFVPEPARGKPVVGVIVCYAGAARGGRGGAAAAAGVRPAGASTWFSRCPTWPCSSCSTRPTSRASRTTGRRTSSRELPDEAVDTFVGHATKPVSPLTRSS